MRLLKLNKVCLSLLLMPDAVPNAERRSSLNFNVLQWRTNGYQFQFSLDINYRPINRTHAPVEISYAHKAAEC